MSKPLIRIPFTGPLPPPLIYPRSANSISGAIDAISNFLTASPPPLLRGTDVGRNELTVLLTGAGISVASGLADYRGENGTYRRNLTYRPHLLPRIHLPARGTEANVDSFHSKAHPHIPVVELHGYLRSLVCVNCRRQMSREDFQAVLLRLNPAWAEFLEQIAKTGALDTHDREEQQKKGLQMNPDGDVDLPNAPYSKFRYPPCPHCLENPPLLRDGTQGIVEAEPDGAISPTSNAGILKPAVIMFGESVDERVKEQAEDAVDEAGKLLVLGSSLATFSAWRFVERAIARGMSIGILNVGGVRNEARLFQEADGNGFIDPTMRVRCSERAEFVLPQVAAHLDPISLA
ncbi:conserved hypothetical protein [Histoplasma capsulatum var. duboisii H88]|uniref:Deacetylase sirtuin-type domain-containing protein n=2 Tax=Ajellomyces capsulatus (strain H88) TaxID=544711 RepID=F0UL14_AJEC8|nr:conserved hypothetical protein [Histoplasma capsulatum var. duboisii H88]